MDLSKVSDLKELKSMAYDWIAAKENAENNIHVINQRIAQVQQQDGEPLPEPSPEEE